MRRTYRRSKSPRKREVLGMAVLAGGGGSGDFVYAPPTGPGPAGGGFYDVVGPAALKKRITKTSVPTQVAAPVAAPDPFSNMPDYDAIARQEAALAQEQAAAQNANSAADLQ